jgi:DNA-binding transcriptional LysR family regulator
MARLRFRQLQLVSNLGRTHNLNAAARQMVMTQPAATKMLQEVEDIVGCLLFERYARGMRPTEVGHLAIAYSHRAIDEAIKFLDDARVLREGGQGVIHIGAIMAAAQSLLPDAIADLKRHRPLLTVRLMTGTSDQLVIALLQHRIDLVVGRRSETTSSATTFTPLAGEEPWLFVAADHPFAKQDAIDTQALLGQPWVLQPITSPLRVMMEQFFDEHDGHPRSLVETTSVYATFRLVCQAQMISVLPSVIVDPEVARGTVKRLPVELGAGLNEFGLITRTDERHSEDLDELMATLSQLAEASGQRAASAA